MTKEELYASAPKILGRIMLFGLPAASLFLAIWYFGGVNVYGHFMEITLQPLRALMDVIYLPGEAGQAAFAYRFIYEGEPGQLDFPINLWHLTMVQIVTLLAIWPHKSLNRFLHLAFWSCFLLWGYHIFNMYIQLLDIQFGPKYASQKGVFWEPSIGYQVLSKIAAFDKFIVRYWGGFGIFLMALIIEFLVYRRFFQASAGQEDAPKRKKHSAKS